MKVKKYTPDCFFAVYGIEKESFSDFWSEKAMKEELKAKQAHYYVAEENGEILGYIGFWLIYDEAEIMKVAVKTNVRKNGVGNALLKAAMDEASFMGAKKMLLEVRKSNAPARRLYEKNGFISYHTRERYYEGTEDAVLYKKNL